MNVKSAITILIQDSLNICNFALKTGLISFTIQNQNHEVFGTIILILHLLNDKTRFY